MWMDWFHGVTFFEQTPFATNFLRALELKISPASCSRQIDCIEFQIRFTSQISQVLEDVVTICYNVVIALCCYTLNKELKPHKMHKIAPWSGSRRACDRSERMCALHAHHSPASRWKKTRRKRSHMKLMLARQKESERQVRFCGTVQPLVPFVQWHPVTLQTCPSCSS